jgi:hypothetical protein
MTNLNTERIDQKLNRFVKRKIRKIGRVFYGDFEERVAVLGAFDTWPYIDFISRIIAKNNYVAVTSRYIYKKFGQKILRFSTQEMPSIASQRFFMSRLLDQIITNSSYAIINFSVSAAHFIETDWCFQKSVKTLGIAYVRSPFNPLRTTCEHLEPIETPSGLYTVCKVTPDMGRTAWDCIESPKSCPLIEQGISKNVVEYFFRGSYMEIVAVENMNVLPFLIQKKLPTKTITDESLKPLGDTIGSHHELFLTKECVYTLLCIYSSIQKDYWERASSLKLLSFAEKTSGLRIEDIKRSRKIKSTEYMRMIRKGYLDTELIGEEFSPYINMLGQKRYLDIKYAEVGPKLEAKVVKLTRKGKKVAEFLKNL